MLAQPANAGASAMLRVRLKADGRLVEILPDGSEQPMTLSNGQPAPRSNGSDRFVDAAFARNVRGRTGLTQTVRNWEQGKRSPRGPARALLRVIEGAPEAAFAVLGGKHR
jgi:putative transcriptional regulator